MDAPDTPVKFANRMRRFARVLWKGLRLEFVHNRRTARLWEEAMDELMAVVDEWRVRWPDWMEEDDYVVWQAVRYLVGQAADDFRRLNNEPASATSEWDVSRPVVEATYRAAVRLEEVVGLLREWRRQRGNLAMATDHLGHLGQFVSARDKLVVAIRNFQEAVRVPYAPAGPDDNPGLFALKPYLRLCERSRRVFQLLFLLQVVSPDQLDSSLLNEITQLCERAHTVMPTGRLRLAVRWRAEELERLLKSAGGPATEPAVPQWNQLDFVETRTEYDVDLSGSTLAICS